MGDLLKEVELNELNKKRVSDRIERTRLLNIMSDILGTGSRQNFCSKFISEFTEHGRLLISKDLKRAKLLGLAVCGSSWLCPVCAEVIARRKAEEIRDMFDWSNENNLHISMVTLTVRHNKQTNAVDLFDSVSGAMSKITANSGYRNFKKTMGIKGYIRALEVTHGENGFHPHLHIIFCSEIPMRSGKYEEQTFVDKDGDTVHYQKKIENSQDENDWFAWWSDAISDYGYDCDPLIGVVINDGERAGDYINKRHELTTKHQKEIHWDAADEMTRARLKKGRKKSKSIWELLALCEERTAPQRTIIKLFAEAVKGKSALQWSRGFKDLVGIKKIVSDQKLAETADYDQFYGMGIDQHWIATIQTLVKGNPIPELLEMYENKGREHVESMFEKALLRASPQSKTQINVRINIINEFRRKLKIFDLENKDNPGRTDFVNWDHVEKLQEKLKIKRAEKIREERARITLNENKKMTK